MIMVIGDEEWMEMECLHNNMVITELGKTVMEYGLGGCMIKKKQSS